MMDTHQLSERRACQLSGVSRTAFRYEPTAPHDAPLRARLIELASKHKALGYPMLHGMLKSEGLVVNKKQTYRVYSEERLQLRQCNKKKLDRPRVPLVVPIGVNIRWSMDFVSDQLSNGRRFRVLNVKDDYSKELVGQLTAFSISGTQAARFLNLLIEQRSAPDQITCDNGTEFTSKAMFFGKKNRVSNWHLSSQANRLKMLLLKV
jgi:putative transposase